MATIEKPGGESVVDKAKHTAADLASAAREKLNDKVETLTDKVVDKAGVQRDRAASSLGSVAQAIRQTGDTLGDEAGLPPAVTNYVGRAAEGVERLGDYLDGKNLGDIASDVERFARREPALFLGGAFVLGLMGARFLKSSARRSANYDASFDRGYERSNNNNNNYGTRSFGGYEDRFEADRYGTTGYQSSSYAREPMPMQHTATPTPMAPPRRDPTMNTSGNIGGSTGNKPSGITQAGSTNPITPGSTPRGGSGSTGNS